MKSEVSKLKSEKADIDHKIKMFEEKEKMILENARKEKADEINNLKKQKEALQKKVQEMEKDI